MTTIATNRVTDDGLTALVHDPLVHTDQGTQDLISTAILDILSVGLGHRQVMAGIFHHVGYLATMMWTVRGRGGWTVVNPTREGASLSMGCGGIVTEAAIYPYLTVRAFDTHEDVSDFNHAIGLADPGEIISCKIP